MSLRPRYQVKSSSTSANSSLLISREKIIMLFFLGAFFLLWLRFLYLQLVKGKAYDLLSQAQHQKVIGFAGERGKIYTGDNYLLVGNHQIYRLYATASQVEDSAALLAQVTPIILADPEASSSLKSLAYVSEQVDKKKNGTGLVVLANKLSQATKEKLESLNLTSLSFEPELVRFYPEVNLAAQVIGFLSKDNGVGHYGIEGGLNKELESKNSQAVLDVDVYKNPIYLSSSMLKQNLDGRDVYLTLRRDIQVLLEDSLIQALSKYGASRGEIIVLEPKTGKILGLATAPSYNPEKYPDFDPSLYKNPAVVDLFEPGSTFKILTVAAGIDAGVISPDTSCTKCAGPRQVADATIKTWNGVYNPGITMTSALEKSDNTAMVYITDLLGSQTFKKYLTNFGIGQPVGLEIEEDVTANFPKVWGPVETATRSFGQGISLSSLQLVRAVAAIANDGKMMKPYLVDKALDKSTGEIFETQPVVLSQVISPNSAKTVAKMLQQAAKHGEAQYVYKNTDQIAGKTGTAQIPVNGRYSPDETIASFIGFAPYDDPKFVMLVKLERPKTSIWAAETAAPLWKEIAEKLFVIFNLN